MARVAVFPGNFDPLTHGHLDIARRAAQMFDTLFVAVYETPRKPILFSVAERLQLFQTALSSVSNAHVESYAGLTVEYARSRGATVVVRGLRATTDFEYEYQMALMNRYLAPDIEAIFLMTSLEYQYISSSLVKEAASLGADLRGLVPDHVVTALAAKLDLVRQGAGL